MLTLPSFLPVPSQSDHYYCPPHSLRQRTRAVAQRAGGAWPTLRAALRAETFPRYYATTTLTAPGETGRYLLPAARVPFAA